MKHINRQNFVILKRDSELDGDEDAFKRMFALLHEPTYAFKYHLRRFLAIDTREIKRPYRSALIVAARIDANIGIMPIDFC